MCNVQNSIVNAIRNDFSASFAILNTTEDNLSASPAIYNAMATPPTRTASAPLA